MTTIRKAILFMFMILAVATIYRISYSLPLLEQEKVVEVIYRGHHVKTAYTLAPVYARDYLAGFLFFGWLGFLQVGSSLWVACKPKPS